VLNNWCRKVKTSESVLRVYCEAQPFYLGQNGSVTKYRPASTLITFPQFRKYVYPNIIPPIEKRVVGPTPEEFEKWTVEGAGRQQPKEKPEQYGFKLGTYTSLLYNDIELPIDALKKALEGSPLVTTGYIFKLVKTITKKTTYEIE
jgi:hypothetical protein